MSKPSLSALMKALKTAEVRGPKNPAGSAAATATPAGSDGGASLQAQVATAPGASSLDPHVAEAATAVAQAPPAPSEQKQPSQTQKTLRELLVRRFVTELLRPENRYNATQAYIKVVAREGTTEKSARTMAVRLLAEVDVLDELDRQLKGIDASADLDETYVYRQWRAIATANLFSILEIDRAGRCTGFKVAPEDWTLEQQLSVTSITFHDSGHLKSLKLVDRQKAVDSIAKARKMFVYDESGTAVVDMAKLITERMSAAAKRTGRTFDHETGKVV